MAALKVHSIILVSPEPLILEQECVPHFCHLPKPSVQWLTQAFFHSGPAAISDAREHWLAAALLNKDGDGDQSGKISDAQVQVRTFPRWDCSHGSDLTPDLESS